MKIRFFLLLVIVFIINNLNASINISFPNNNGTGVLNNGLTYVCRTDPSNNFLLSINIVSPFSNGGSTDLRYRIVVNNDVYHNGRYNGVPNNGTSTNITFTMDANTFLNSGNFSIEADWLGMPSIINENSNIIYYIVKGIELKLENSDNDGMILFGNCFPKGYIKAVANVCPGTMANYAIEVQEIDFATGANVGNVAFKNLNSAEVVNINAGIFSLEDYILACPTCNFSLTNNRRYRLQIIVNNNNGLWMEKTLRFTYKTTKSEVFIRDHHNQSAITPGVLKRQDNGYEPNLMNVNVFRSPDLWNSTTFTSGPIVTSRNDNRGLQLHEDPEYNVGLNYIYTKVNMMGCENNSNTNLRLFWTRARLGELWSRHWLYNLSNNATASGYPMGSEITLLSPSVNTPYSNASSPINSGSYSYNQSVILPPVAWYPPNPSQYNPSNGSMTGNNEPVICLLARLQEKNSSYDPIIWEPNSVNQNIEPYVRNNNNVATRNTALVEGPNPNSGVGINWNTTNYYTVVANNPSGAPTTICLTNISPILSNDDNLLNYGEIEIGFTSGIWNNWISNGMNGFGFSVVEPYVISVTDPDRMCLENIFIGNNMNEQIGVRMNWDLGVNYNADSLYFLYALEQVQYGNFPYFHGSDVVFEFPAFYEQSSALGSTILRSAELNTGSVVDKDKKTKKEEDLKKKKDEKNKKGKNKGIVDEVISETSYQLFPNPSNSSSTLTIFNVEDSQIQELKLFDVSGKEITVQIDLNYRFNTALATVNTIELSEGIYFIKWLQNGELKSVKLSVLH